MISRILKLAIMAYACYFLFGAFMAPHAAHTGQFEIADQYYGVFSASCQQQGSRSFWFEGYPMALCARCLGTYLGFLGMGLVWLFKPAKIGKKLFLLLLVPGLGEKVTEYLGWEGSNEFRFVAGVFLGAAILAGLALLCQLVWRLWKKNAPEQIRLSGP